MSQRFEEPPLQNNRSEEAVTLIAETAAHLRGLARHHKLDLLSYLLAMVQLEADEHIKLLKRRKLS
ncbi:hypothetical protein [Bradyrhizobium sp.]|uniref:hypothetical protein n=1 Tax=Bradyrhizobium sp. TaxID=376 RepID=UPI003C39AC58